MSCNIYDIGYVRITAPHGVRDKRNGSIYKVVICKLKDSKWFEEYVPEEA